QRAGIARGDQRGEVAAAAGSEHGNAQGSGHGRGNQFVIPTQAGIQSENSCEARRICSVSCTSHDAFRWVPAFAGMTLLQVGGGSRVGWHQPIWTRSSPLAFTTAPITRLARPCFANRAV